MTTDTELRVLELRDSVAWAAGVGYERRRIGEVLRQRALLLEHMPGSTPRVVVKELRRLADDIDREPT
jgi:adenosylmethionine-8-amino-7-oxononanoate aminotransferase